jgi:hypothetical protein
MSKETLITFDLEKIGAGVVTFLFGGVAWLVRRVLTNEKQIALLKNEIEHNQQIRQQDRELIQEIQKDVKQLLQKK